MKIHKRNFVYGEHISFLSSLLFGRIFHVTSYSNFERIRKDKFIYNNKEAKYPLNASSLNSMGRLNGFVCLFDFRNLTKDIHDEAWLQYDFYNPSWFSIWDGKKMVWHIAYFLLKSDFENMIISNSFARDNQKSTEKFLHYIPKVECWYPGDLPIEYIELCLLLKIIKKIPKDSLEYAQLSSAAMK